MPHSSPKMEYPYRPEWFVGREQPLDLGLMWVYENPPKRVLLIHAPPKTGKSWFLGRYRERLSDKQIAYIFIDVTKHLKQGDKLTPEVQKSIVNQLSELLGVPLLNEIADIVAHFEGLIIPTTKTSLEYIIIFDGLDEISEDDWDEFQSVILKPLLRHSNLRFILAVREEFGLSYPWHKSFNFIKLPALNPSEAKKHCKNLNNILSNPQKQQDILVYFGLNQQYQWDHAGTNTFIYKCLEKNIYPFPVERYLMSFEVVFSEPEIKETRELLKVIFSIGATEWTEQEFAFAYNSLYTTPYSDIAIGDKWSFLINHSIIGIAEDKPPYHRIILLGLSVIAPLL